MTRTPDELRYVRDHHWIRVVAPGIIRLGITDFAQESLGDVVAVGLPKLGSTVQAGYACGEIESTKSVNDLVSPIDGTVSAVNAPVEDAPELTNSDPYGDGWLFEIQSDPATLDDRLRHLLDALAYRTFTGK